MNQNERKSLPFNNNNQNIQRKNSFHKNNPNLHKENHNNHQKNNFQLDLSSHYIPNPKNINNNFNSNNQKNVPKNYNNLTPPKYLHQQQSKIKTFKQKKILILDLDETLVHSSFKPFSKKSDYMITINSRDKTKIVYVLKRPYAQEFLEEMSKFFEIIIFTASISIYASPLINLLDQKKIVSSKLYRQHCTFFNGVYVKDLRKLGKELKNMIIIDNNPLSYLFNKNNGLPILSWYDNVNDYELIKLIPFLKYLSKVEDVRKIISQVTIIENNTLNFGLINKFINTKYLINEDTNIKKRNHSGNKNINNINPYDEYCNKNNDNNIKINENELFVTRESVFSPEKYSQETQDSVREFEESFSKKYKKLNTDRLIKNNKYCNKDKNGNIPHSPDFKVINTKIQNCEVVNKNILSPSNNNKCYNNNFNNFNNKIINDDIYDNNKIQKYFVPRNINNLQNNNKNYVHLYPEKIKEMTQKMNAIDLALQKSKQLIINKEKQIDNNKKYLFYGFTQNDIIKNDVSHGYVPSIKYLKKDNSFNKSKIVHRNSKHFNNFNNSTSEFFPRNYYDTYFYPQNQNNQYMQNYNYILRNRNNIKKERKRNHSYGGFDRNIKFDNRYRNKVSRNEENKKIYYNK